MIDLTNGLTFDQSPQHYITFGDFDSRRWGLHLHKREAPTPDEKEIVKSIPYAQGVLDLSQLRGDRVYENREVTYTLYRFGVAQTSANGYQTTIENLIMREYGQVLQDSYDPDCHYIGKCRSITTEDDYGCNRLVIEIIFDLYPFKISNYPEGHGLWDPINFEFDCFQNTTYQLGQQGDSYAATREITLYNTGQSALTPAIDFTMFTDPSESETGGWTSTARLRILLRGVTYSDDQFRVANEMPFEYLSLAKGENKMTLTGLGAVSFVWYKELI